MSSKENRKSIKVLTGWGKTVEYRPLLRNYNPKWLHYLEKYDLPSRTNGPAIIGYYDNDHVKIRREEYLIDGKHHRTNDKPTIICYSLEGQVEHEEWHQNGILTRSYLPAFIHVDM